MGSAGRWIYDRNIDDSDRRWLRPDAGDAKGEEEWEAEGSGHQKSEIRNSKSDIFSFYMPEIRATVSVPSVRRVLSV